MSKILKKQEQEQGKEAPKKEVPKKEAPKKEAPKKEAPKKEAPKKEFVVGQKVFDNKEKSYEILSLPENLHDESKIQLLDNNKRVVIRLKRKLRLA